MKTEMQPRSERKTDRESVPTDPANPTVYLGLDQILTKCTTIVF
jgi:hypothetical protein